MTPVKPLPPSQTGRHTPSAVADFSDHHPRVMVCLLLVILTSLPGCSRMFWRSQADFDSYNLLLQKTQDPRWDVPRVTVEADPRSRFYDAYDLDRPPLPPDDPAAQVYMQRVDGMPGYKKWYRFGEQESVENPLWLSGFMYKPEIAHADWEAPSKPTAASLAKGEAVASRLVPTIDQLVLEQAIELAALNSREYQTQIEDTYLSALLLSFDQFQFNVRYLGLNRNEPGTNLTYLNTPSVRDDLNWNSRFGVSQLLPSGGQWIAELANNTLWLFSGSNQVNSTSVLTYQITQPLLLGAGRKVVLENLTQSERSVLYDVRTLARFRKIFFSDIVVNGRGSGFLGLLRQQQQVFNQQSNIRELEIQVRRTMQQNADDPAEPLTKLPDGATEVSDRLIFKPALKQLRFRGKMLLEERDRLLALSNDPEWLQAIGSLYLRSQAGVTTLEVAQLLTRLAQQIANLRDLERGLLDSIDSYKLQLGLPTDFQVTINNRLLKQFELIDPQVELLDDTFLDFKERMLSTINEDEPTIAEVKNATEMLRTLLEQVRKTGLSSVARDLERVDAVLPQRLAKLTSEQDREITQKDLERNRLIFQEVVLATFDEIAGNLTQLEEALEDPQITPEQLRKALQFLDDLREDLLQTAQNLKSVQAGLRSELITLQDFDMTQEEVVALAIENRLDLMNARAAVVDARRQMEVAANRLETVLNIVARGDVANSGASKPFDFRGDRSTFQAGIQFTAPLDQVLERNNYRQVQIAYERARRDYMELEDQIKLQVRQEWRTLKTSAANFETTRQNLRVAALQLDSAIETFNQPAQVAQIGQARTSTGQQNQGLNLINALQSVLQAQNQLIQIWVQYEQNRINIYRDMDIMQVDERGLWIDPVYQNLGSGTLSTPTPIEPANDLTRHPAAGTTLSVLDERDGSVVEFANFANGDDDSDFAGTAAFESDAEFGSDFAGRPQTAAFTLGESMGGVIRTGGVDRQRNRRARIDRALSDPDHGADAQLDASESPARQLSP